MNSDGLGSANRGPKWSFSSMNRSAKPLECSCMQEVVALRNCLIAMGLGTKKRVQMQNRTNSFCTPEHVESKRLGRSAKVHPLKGVRGLHPFAPLYPHLSGARKEESMTGRTNPKSKNKEKEGVKHANCTRSRARMSKVRKQ